MKTEFIPMSTRVRRALASVSLGAILAGGGLVLVASPASAAWSNCSSNYACMWQGKTYPNSPNASFKTALQELTSSNNKVNSVVNRGDTSAVRFYDGANYTGASLLMDREGNWFGFQWRDPDLSNGTDDTSTDWSNRISSGKFV
ncbi:peptidase inhibitor family I36 protein [Salana multivorans]